MNKLRTILTWGLLLAATHVMGYTITVNPIEIEAGQSTNLIINLNNTETNLTAYQMKIFLPTGVTVQKKANGKYAYTSNADRLDPDLFTVTVKDAVDGSVLIAVFSPDKDVIAGTSGELIRLPIDVAPTVTTSLQGSLKEIEFTDVNNQAYNISDVNFTLTIQGSGTLDPGVVTGDVTVSVPDVAITAGSSTNLIINMQTGLTNLTAYQMKLYLPTGVTVQKKANGKYAYTSNADRLDPDLFTVTVKDAADGSVLIAVFSPDKDVIAGTSGELIRLPIDVASTVTTSLQGSLKEIEFTDVNNQAYNISDVNFTMTMGGETSPNITFADPAVKAICVSATTNWDTNHDGELSESEAAAVTDLGEVFRGNTTITSFNELQYFTRLESIGDNAFRHCTALKSVIIPNGVTSIGIGAFWASGLTSITIPNSVTSIGQDAFNDCQGLTTLTIPGSVTEIGPAAFYACRNLSSVVFEDGVTIIGDNAFHYCNSLASISFPNSVTRIGLCAFADCSITSLTLPNSVTSIGGYAFAGCANLTSVTMPPSVITFDGTYAFGGGTNHIESVYITDLAAWLGIDFGSNNPLRNGAKLYLNNEEVKDLVISDGTTAILGAAFEGCESLTSVTIPNSVTSIAGWAFNGCSNMTTVTIPNSVTTIDSNAFMSCGSLTDFWCYAEDIPSTGNDLFLNTDIASATLHVPAASLEAYSTTAPWSGFGTIVPIEEAGIEVTDISQLDNAIYIEPFVARIDANNNMEICLKNAENVSGYAFELVLPEGVTVATDNDGNYIDELTNRHNGQQPFFNNLGENRYSFACLGTNSLTGSDGAIRVLTIHVDENMPEGVYAIEIRDVSLSKTNGQMVEVPNTTTSVSIEECQLGDVNANGKIDIGDAVTIANHLVGKPTYNFVEKASDTNGNGTPADIGDAVTIALYLVGKPCNLSNSVKEWNENEIEPQ